MHRFRKGKTQKKTSLMVEFQAVSLANAHPPPPNLPINLYSDYLAQKSSPEVNFENSNGPYFLSPG